MSFVLDPPMLFVTGILLYFIGNWLGFERLAKMAIGFLVVSTFIAFSVLLYADIFRCVFPFVCNGMSGSAFMFHSNITHIDKNEVPLLVVIFMFALYPLWLYLGYAAALLFTKRRRVTNEVYSYKDVKSKKNAADIRYSVVRYPDSRKNINDPENAARAAVDAIGGMANFVKPGNKVLIKINVCGGVPELRGTFTTKEVTGAVVDMVREAGGVPFICDADMVWTKFWPNAKAEGWIEWAKQKGVEIVNLSETNIVYFDFQSNEMPTERVSKEIIDADVIISIPVMKTHMMTDVTIGMKNMYGTFPEIDKARYHMIGIDQVIYWVNQAFTPNLTVIDGSIGGETVGPLSCDPVDFHTIIASNNVVTADSIAAQLMGFLDPIDDIDHIRLGHERGLGDASIRFDPKTLPYPQSSDCNWKRPDPEVARLYVWGTNTLLQIPGWQTFFNIGSDFLLYDASRLPLLKYFTPSLLQIVNDIGKWVLEKKPDTAESKKRRKTNLAIYSALTLLALFTFASGGFLAKSSLEFSLGLIFVIFLGALFSMRMTTKHLAAISFASIIVSYFIEHYGVLAGMWYYYVDASAPPLFALFSTPLFMITVTGFSYFLKDMFAYIELSGKKLRLVPFAVIILAMAAFLQFEGYMQLVTKEMIGVVYAAFAILGLFHNNRQTLDWNMAILVVAVSMGGMMELLGAASGLWGYHFKEGLPVFLVLGWALNTWAVCGIAQILGAQGKELFSETVAKVTA